LNLRRLLAAGVLLTLAVSACSKAGDTDAGGAVSGGAHSDRLIISTAADPKNLNPALASASPVLELSAFIYSYTVRYDDHARPVPDAVSEIPTVANGDVSKDGLTIKYKLRHGMKWQDGQGDVTCKDMRLTWQVMMNPRNNVNTTDGWKDIKDVDCSDPYVAVVHMKKVYAPYLQQLWSVNGNGPILPEHILGKLNATGSINDAPYNALPVGSGPYRVVSWSRGSEVRLEANPDYYLGKPKISEVVYKIIPDQNTLATQLRTREVGLAWNLDPNSYEQLRSVPGLTTITPVVYIWDHLDFNLTRPMFQDVRVRRALAYAMNRPMLLDKVRHNLGELTDTFLDKTLYPDAYDDQVMKYPYDPAKAKALLDEAGWKVGPDGIRVKNGQRLSFQITTQVESTMGQALQQQVIAQWRAVGADVQVKNYLTSLFFDNGPNGILTNARYDVALYAWSGAADIDQSSLYSGDALPPHGQNYTRWANPRATQAMRDANETVDQKRRIADYKIVQEEFAKDVPTIMMWYRKYPVSYTSDLQGFTATPVITTPFWNPWEYHD
jgi:peptide/nickel transport system substrate-binding protein